MARNDSRNGPGFFVFLVIGAIALYFHGYFDSFLGNVETDPGKIARVMLAQQQECNRGNTIACSDVRQMLACLDGERDYCPVKGHGAF